MGRESKFKPLNSLSGSLSVTHSKSESWAEEKDVIESIVVVLCGSSASYEGS